VQNTVHQSLHVIFRGVTEAKRFIVVIFGIIFQLEYAHRKKDEGKKTRMEKEVVMDSLFKAFETHQYYNVKDLVRITNQPIVSAKYTWIPGLRCTGALCRAQLILERTLLYCSGKEIDIVLKVQIGPQWRPILAP